MEIRAADLSYKDTYKMLTGCVVPRPVAWVTSMSDTDVVNAAPFSAFTFVSIDPPQVLFLSSRREREKDTEANVRRTKQFVVNFGNESLLEDLHMSSAPLPPHQSEPRTFGIELAPSKTIRVPRIKASPICFECVASQFLEFGTDPHVMIIGKVQHFYVADEIYSNGRIDQKALRPIARIGGPTYASLGNLIHMPEAKAPLESANPAEE